MLRQITFGDQHSVFQGLSHPRVIRYYGVEYHAYAETGIQMNWYREILEKETGIWWALTTPEIRTLLGTCGLYNIQTIHQKAELGYWLLPEYWGQGLMRHALEAVLAYGFDTLLLHRIEAYVETENPASARLLERLGFVREGTLRDTEIKHGKFISLDVYAKLAE